MNNFNNKEYLKNNQYATSENLDARIALHKKYTPKGKDYLDFVWDLYRFNPDDAVLEVGCGNGLFWTYQHTAKLPSINLTLTDISEGMLDKAKQNLSDFKTEVKFETADVEQLTYADDSYDVVLAHFMLYHAESQSKAIDEIKRVLKPDGWAGIILVAKESMNAIFQAAHKIAPGLNQPNPTSSLFSADDGYELLSSKFGHVDKHVYKYEMKVDEVDVIVKYAQSSPSFQDKDLPKEFWNDYADYVDKQIADQGTFKVAKSFVLFVCRNHS